MSKALFQDKIQIATIAVEKELEMINQFNTCANLLKFGLYPIARIDELPSYRFCWNHVGQLYDFLKNDYFDDLDQDEKDKINDIMKKYQISNNLLTFDDLYYSKEIILKAMAKSGFHDVIRGGEEDEGFGEF